MMATRFPFLEGDLQKASFLAWGMLQTWLQLLCDYTKYENWQDSLTTISHGEGSAARNPESSNGRSGTDTHEIR